MHLCHTFNWTDCKFYTSYSSLDYMSRLSAFKVTQCSTQTRPHWITAPRAPLRSDVKHSQFQSPNSPSLHNLLLSARLLDFATLHSSMYCYIGFAMRYCWFYCILCQLSDLHSGSYFRLCS